jgi:dihydrofolate reductase
MGRTTYDIGRKVGLTSPYPHLRQIVVSSSITASPDPAVEVVGQDVAGTVRALKAEDGKDVWLAGGGRLAASLVDEIDELILKVNPSSSAPAPRCSTAPSARGRRRRRGTRCTPTASR